MSRGRLIAGGSHGDGRSWQSIVTGWRTAGRAAVGAAATTGWYPCPELNGDARFRKPLLYPFELQGQTSTIHPAPRPARSPTQERRQTNRAPAMQQTDSGQRRGASRDWETRLASRPRGTILCPA